MMGIPRFSHERTTGMTPNTLAPMCLIEMYHRSVVLRTCVTDYTGHPSRQGDVAHMMLRLTYEPSCPQANLVLQHNCGLLPLLSDGDAVKRYASEFATRLDVFGLRSFCSAQPGLELPGAQVLTVTTPSHVLSLLSDIRLAMDDGQDDRWVIVPDWFTEISPDLQAQGSDLDLSIYSTRLFDHRIYFGHQDASVGAAIIQVVQELPTRYNLVCGHRVVRPELFGSQYIEMGD